VRASLQHRYPAMRVIIGKDIHMIQVFSLNHPQVWVMLLDLTVQAEVASWWKVLRQACQSMTLPS
jgi:hypothetical protein